MVQSNLKLKKKKIEAREEKKAIVIHSLNGMKERKKGKKKKKKHTHSPREIIFMKFDASNVSERDERNSRWNVDKSTD